VRWQNERYAMPAVAWLLSCAALGLARALSELKAPKLAERAPALAGLVLTLLFAWRQIPRFNEQVWFFGRASRNIYDQHVQVGRIVRDRVHPQPARVLVGDAGAISYISDIPALDMIGLGGFRGLPFARATRQHVGASIELLERLPPSERPDLLAIYPSWWGDFPIWFGRRMLEVPVRGNVICGGLSKVLYRPRWDALDLSARPFSIKPGERARDALDHADLVSEGEHGYALSHGKVARVEMKLLPHPHAPRRDLWDAGRIVPAGASESFTLSRLDPLRPVVLILRAAPSSPAALSIEANLDIQKRIELAPGDVWQELRIELGRPGVRRLPIRVRAEHGEYTLFHVWAVQPDQ
jgi:hypothetical protein